MGARGPRPNIDSSRRAAGSHWAESEARSRGSGRTDPRLPEGTADSPLRAPAHRGAAPGRRAPARAPAAAPSGSARGRGAAAGRDARGRRRLLPRSSPPGVTAGWETAARTPLRASPRPRGGPGAAPCPRLPRAPALWVRAGGRGRAQPPRGRVAPGQRRSPTPCKGTPGRSPPRRVAFGGCVPPGEGWGAPISVGSLGLRDRGGLAGELPLTLSSPLVACEGRGWEPPFSLWPLAGRPFPTLVVKV